MMTEDANAVSQRIARGVAVGDSGGELAVT